MTPQEMVAARLQKGWSQEELAHRAGVSPGQVSKAETGKRLARILVRYMEAALRGQRTLAPEEALAEPKRRAPGRLRLIGGGS